MMIIKLTANFIYFHIGIKNNTNNDNVLQMSDLDITAQYDLCIPSELSGNQSSSGEREPPVEGTPSPYFELCQQCLDDDPKKRPDIPDIQNVLEKLEQISLQDIKIDNNQLSLGTKNHIDNSRSQSDIDSQYALCISAVSGLETSKSIENNYIGKFIIFYKDLKNHYLNWTN